MVSRHFLWLGPLSNLLFFLGMGLVLSVAVKLSPRAAGWLGPRLDLRLRHTARAHGGGPSDLP